MATAETQHRSRPKIYPSDRFFYAILLILAVLVIALPFTIAGSLLKTAALTFKEFGLGFVATSTWDPVNEVYGAWPVLFGTVTSSLLAICIATPISVAVALYLNELAPRLVKRPLSFMVEMLAAIPSVVYGLWGIFVLAPLLREFVQPPLSEHLGFLPFFDGAPYGVGMMAAAIVLAIMICPTITTICREVFSSIPQHQREAALAIGATRWESIYMTVYKSSKSGIIGAVVLGLGRAIGETMAVTMVIGNRAQVSLSLFAPSQTMASVIANEYAEATTDLHISALVSVGVLLFALTLLINGAAHWVITRSRKRDGV